MNYKLISIRFTQEEISLFYDTIEFSIYGLYPADISTWNVYLENIQPKHSGSDVLILFCKRKEDLSEGGVLCDCCYLNFSTDKRVSHTNRNHPYLKKLVLEHLNMIRVLDTEDEIRGYYEL